METLDKILEVWYPIHAFIMEHKWLQFLITYLIVEAYVRLKPGATRESATEIAGRYLRLFLDKTGAPNPVKIVDENGNKKVVDANPKNAEKDKVA